MFIRAEKGKGLRITYHRNDGGKLIRIGGSRAWRNNNPGNVVKGPFSKENGAIGESEGFAVFPDYAPSFENNVENYRKLLRQFTKLDIDRKIISLDAIEFQKLLNAVERVEGWKPGKEEAIEPAKINSVRRDKKGIIVAYQVSGKGWLSKAQLIALIDSEGGVDAVVVHSSTRASYIRMRPDSVRPNNLNKRT